MTLFFSIMGFILSSWILTEVACSASNKEFFKPSSLVAMTPVLATFAASLLGIINALEIIPGLALAVTIYTVWELLVTGLKKYGDLFI